MNPTDPHGPTSTRDALPRRMRSSVFSGLSVLSGRVLSGRARALLPAILPTILFGFTPACGGGGGSAVVGGAFTVLKTDPPNNGQIFLNQSLTITFSREVNLDSVNFNSVAFFPYDAAGNPLSEQVVGTFRYGRDEFGKVDQRVIEFIPRLPSNDTFTNGGLKPGRTYLVSLVGATNRVNPTVRDLDNRKLSPTSPIKTLTFRTASGSTPKELFLDTKIGGPRVLTIDIAPKIGNKVSLNKLGELPVEIKLEFNQPLNPSTLNVPLGQDPDPSELRSRLKGKIFLEYDDPEIGKRQWIHTIVTMPRNDLTGATVLLRPDAVLPNAAQIRIVAEAELEDISGESNVKDASYRRVVGTFQTEDAFAQQFDAVVLEFERGGFIDLDAPFRDPVAELQNGVLKASFDFEGLQTPFDYGPTSKETVINTDVDQVFPKNGPPITVRGGVFSFRNIEIPEGKLVRGVGTNPLVFLATGDVKVRGHLSVNGGEGGQVDTLNSAGFPTAGGQGAATGGNGGKGSQNVTGSTQAGETGSGPGQRPGQGGKGGAISCGSTGGKGGGGGGGSHSTVGDPEFAKIYASKRAQALGPGGNGTSGAAGGKPGPLVYADEDPDNNFYGRMIDKNGKVVIGELPVPLGGAGGGGGGDVTGASSCQATNFISDRKGGGGGGGGGVLIIKALGRIEVGPKGRISADGGTGGGGEWAGSSRYGGGGGGGSGGMVILMSATGIDLYQHGTRFANKDSNFSVTAEGAIGRNTSFGSAGRMAKYSNIASGASNGGGFGGMGVVQLMAPPGTDADGTGTVQDDNIRVLDSAGTPVSGAIKTQYLFSGDVRPDPLLPQVEFSRFSRGLTRWIDTGATVRREVSSATGPRAVVAPGKAGPDWFFSGLIKSGGAAGYFATSAQTGGLDPVLVDLGGKTRVPVTRAVPNAQTRRGRVVHEVGVAAGTLPSDRSLSNFRARLLNEAGAALSDFRILDHTSGVLFLDASENPLPSAGTTVDSVEVIAKFFEVAVDGDAGLGVTYERTVGTTVTRLPIANVQVGFAFHKNPSTPNISGGQDLNRFPKDRSAFIWDLESTGTGSKRAELRALHYPYVQVMVRFNMNFDPTKPDTTPGPNPVGPGSARPELRNLLLPFGF